MFIEKKFGELLRKRREWLELSLREIAQKVGITHSYLSQIERKGKDVSAPVFVALARALELAPNMADLFGFRHEEAFFIYLQYPTGETISPMGEILAKGEKVNIPKGIRLVPLADEYASSELIIHHNQVPDPAIPWDSAAPYEEFMREWHADREQEEELINLWRRMAANVRRSYIIIMRQAEGYIDWNEAPDRPTPDEARRVPSGLEDDEDM